MLLQLPKFIFTRAISGKPTVNNIISIDVAVQLLIIETVNGGKVS